MFICVAEEQRTQREPQTVMVQLDLQVHDMKIIFELGM